MELISAIQYVGTGLTLVGFIVAALALAYQQRLKSKEQQILAIPDSDKLRAAESAAEYIHVDLRKIPPKDRASIVIEQLGLKAQRQWQVFISVLVLATLIGVATIAAMALLPRPEPVVAEEEPTPETTTSVAYQVCIGQYESGCGPHNVHLGCGEDVKAWAARQCQSLAGEVAAVGQVSVRAGNMCGYGNFTVVCTVTN